MKTALIISGACVIVLCIAGSAALIGTIHSKRDLREAKQKIHASERQADALLAEKEELARQLNVSQELNETLQSRVAELEKSNVEDSDSEVGIPVVAPFQAQAYLGKTPIGWVWIIPQNLRMDTNAQRYVYDPVVWLDEGMRKQFVTHHTNFVEREVQAQDYVNTAYYPEPVYYVSSPFIPTHPIHRPPGMSNRPPVTSLPPAPIQPPPRQPFNPGNGSITVQKLGTPAGAIKTRPTP